MLLIGKGNKRTNICSFVSTALVDLTLKGGQLSLGYGLLSHTVRCCFLSTKKIKISAKQILCTTTSTLPFRFHDGTSQKEVLHYFTSLLFENACYGTPFAFLCTHLSWFLVAAPGGNLSLPPLHHHCHRVRVETLRMFYHHRGHSCPRVE